MSHLPTGLLLSFALLTALLPVGAQTTTAPEPAIQFGMDAGAVTLQKNAGVAPDYGTFWIGPWTLSSGWGGPDAMMTNMKNAGVTPAIHFYYWGDDISPSCVENGCWSSLHNAQKTRAGWEQLGTQLTDHLNAKMGGAPVVIFLESEFNKGGIETYEPFDGYMAAEAAKIRAAYPAAIIVLGFGNWGSNHWGTYDRAAAASDMVGIQGMRGSTRQTPEQMMTLYDGLLTGVKALEAKFPGKPIMLTDIAVSSYPEPGYLGIQRDVLKEVFDNLAILKAHGVEAMIYRSWKDSMMDPANYYGYAEQHWGLTWAGNGTQKAAGKVWVDGVKAERAGGNPAPPPSPPPAAIQVGAGVTTQAETFTIKQAGGKQSDSLAQGGTSWNLWSNGAIAQPYNLTGTLDLTVRARGTSAGGVAPHMDVFIGTTRVLAADPGTSYADYNVVVSNAGAAELRIVFTNDAKTATEDRNLLIDTVTLAPANKAPSASFTVATDGLAATLDASSSSDPEGAALTHAWTFGDGTNATGVQASHAYAEAGTYTVTLTASDGRLAATASKQVTVLQPNRAPSASFVAAVDNLSVAVDATGSSDLDGDALAYTWTFGDGASATGATASHSYVAAGTYTVTVTASDGELASTSSTTVTAIQPNRAPTASFTAASTNLSVVVDATGSSDLDGDALTYAWTFGDGASAAGVTASRTYAAAGTYTVTLTVSDGDLSSTATRTVTAIQPNRAPTATFTAASSGLAARFDASGSSDVDGDALTYGWTFGDGTSATGFTVNHTYAGAGDYTVVLTVSDGDLASTATRTVTAVQPNRAPSAAFTTTSSQLTVSADASASSDLDGDALSYAWSWGDGTSATGKVASRTYAAAGTYTVQLTVSDGKLSSTTTKAVTVTKPATSTSTSTTSTSTTSTSKATSYTATVTPSASSNEWWVQVGVSPAPAKVEVKAGSGAWILMDKQSYGYTKSFNVPKGTSVSYRVTDTAGHVMTTPSHAFLVDMAPLKATSSPTPTSSTTTTTASTTSPSTTTTTASTTSTASTAFKATFTPKAVGNDWWVEAKVNANQPIAKVEAKVNGGAYVTLTKTQYDSYAKSINAPNGSKVTFRATSTTGATYTSVAYTWT